MKLKTLLTIAYSCIVLTALTSAPGLSAEERNASATAPLPIQITNARRVFISNGGDDPHFKRLGLGRSNNQFYAAMKEWGRYELVSPPTEADVVLEVQLASQLEQYGNDLRIVPLLRLAILDPKTHTTLWVFTEELETHGLVGAHQDAKFDNAMERIVSDVKGLMEQHPQSQTPAKP